MQRDEEDLLKRQLMSIEQMSPVPSNPTWKDRLKHKQEGEDSRTRLGMTPKSLGSQYTTQFEEFAKDVYRSPREDI